MNVIYRNFVNGVWGGQALRQPGGTVHVQNPGNLSMTNLGSYAWSLADAEASVVAARSAFPAWRSMPWGEREGILRAAQATIKARREDLARCISLEMGKPITQSRLEMDAVANKFDITLPDAREMLETRPHPDPRAADTLIRAEPLGVTAVVGPFNFPAHLVNGMVLPALATGNTVILKPASNTPGIWRLLTEIFAQAGLPAGVLNYVVGDRRVGQALASHPDVDALLFTGGVAAGRALKAAAAETHKEVKLEMGGQGVALVLEDANIEKAADMIATGATVRGGQNCNATRNCFVVGEKAARTMKEALAERFARLRVGDQFEDGIDFGPLASDPERGFRADLNAVLSLGCRVLFEGSLPEGLPEGYYAGAVLYERPKESFPPRDSSEIFGPALGVTPVDSEEEGLALMNLLHLRLSAAIHSANHERARELARRSRWGQTVINGPTVGASSLVDFAGMGEATYGGAGGRAMTAHTVATVNIVEKK